MTIRRYVPKTADGKIICQGFLLPPFLQPVVLQPVFLRKVPNPVGNLIVAKSRQSMPKDLAGLPPTVIVTAGCDILRDEGASLHRALIAAGVTSRYQCVPGVLHGFIRFDAFCPESQQTIDWIATQI
jgi:acetyl esterase/lipase